MMSAVFLCGKESLTMTTWLGRARSLTVAGAIVLAHLGRAPSAAGQARAAAEPALAAPVTTIVVNTPVDELNRDGDCSLREAVRAANLDAPVDACAAGSGVDTISLPAGAYLLTRLGSDDTAAAGDLDLNSSLTLNGAGSTTTFVDGNQIDRIFDIAPGVTVRLNNLTIRNGAGGVRDGGAIHNSGTLYLTNTTVRRSFTDGRGGGIYNVGVLQLANSFVTANWSGAYGGGGGLYNGGQGTATLTKSTVRDNISDEYGGGGLFNDVGATLSLNNSTVSGNRNNEGGAGAGILNRGVLSLSRSAVFDNLTGGPGSGLYNGGSATVVNSTLNSPGGTIANGTTSDWEGPESGALTLNNVTVDTLYNRNGSVTLRNTLVESCGGMLNSQGYNLIQNAAGCTLSGATTGNRLGVDPQLGPLQNNGGTTWTRALLLGSPAIDAANPNASGTGGNRCAAKDQRGTARPRDGNGDGIARCDIGTYER
jgi:CSLREA domain-containing protein